MARQGRRWAARGLWLLTAAIAGGGALAAMASGPPDQLVRENCEKSGAIVTGRIVSDATKPGQFTATELVISKAYKGPFQAGQRITYYTFRENSKRSAAFLKRPITVFLAERKDEQGKRQWGEASDLCEFPATKELDRQVKAALQSISRGKGQ